MDNNTDNHFWPSYVDLMTSIFFIMLVLFILSYFFFIQKKKELEEANKALKKEKNKIEMQVQEFRKVQEIKKTVAELMKDKDFFIYEKKYKRFKLAQEIEFKKSQWGINEYEVENYYGTKKNLEETGKKLKETIETLLIKKTTDTLYKNISYLMIITGSASKEGDSYENYILSYHRAYSLYEFWKNNIVDFDKENYRQIIDLQISGVGIGGIGRNDNEEKNRCFYIQIIPKIGTIDEN